MYRISFRLGAIAAFISLAACAQNPQRPATARIRPSRQARHPVCVGWNAARFDQ